MIDQVTMLRMCMMMGSERERAVSEGEGEHDEVPVAAVEDPISGEVQTRNVSVGLQSLDEVDLERSFQTARPSS